MKTLLTLLIVFLVAETSAQVISGAGATINAGYASIPSIRASLNSLAGDSANFENGYTTVGLDGFYLYHKAVITASGYIGFQRAQFQNKRSIEPFTWSAHTGFGWIVSETRSFQLYPNIGVGATGTSLTWYRSPYYEELHAVKAIAPSVDVAITTNIFFKDHVTPHDVSQGIVLSFKVGYTRSVSDVRWQGSESSQVVTPRQLQLWHASVSMGGIGFFRIRR